MKERMLYECTDLKEVLHEHRKNPAAGFRVPFLIMGSIALIALDVILFTGIYRAPWWIDLLVGLTTLYGVFTSGDAWRVFCMWKENNYIGYIASVEMLKKDDPGSLRVRFYPADTNAPENPTTAPRLLLALGGWNVDSRIEHPGSPLATFPWKILSFSFTAYEPHWFFLEDEIGNRFRFSLSELFFALMLWKQGTCRNFNEYLRDSHGSSTEPPAVSTRDRPN